MPPAQNTRSSRGVASRLARAEARLTAFVEDRMIDPHGLVRGILNAETARPWTPDEIQRKRITFPAYFTRGGDTVGQITYEDSLMATGEYAQSRILKHRATRAPDALAQAALPISALLRVLEEGARYEPGFLPKPHGGILRAASSHEISVDQYIKTITALRLWQQYCGPATRRQIDAHLIAMAEYHLRRGFIHPRREVMIVTPENRTHGIALFIPLLVLAHKLTRRPEYRKALTRFDPILDALLAGDVPTNCNIVSLFMDGFDLAIAEGHRDPRLPRLIARLWHARLRDTRRLGLWNDDPGQRFPSSRALRIAAFAPIVDRHVPGANAAALALRLLKGITDPRKMLYANGPTSVPAGAVDWPRLCICETSITSWLVAYWSHPALARPPQR